MKNRLVIMPTQKNGDTTAKIHPFNEPYDIFLNEISSDYRHVEDITARHEGVDYVVGHYKNPKGFHYYFMASQISAPAGWLMLMGKMTDEENDDVQTRLDLMLPVAIKYTLRWERDHVLINSWKS